MKTTNKFTGRRTQTAPLDRIINFMVPCIAHIESGGENFPLTGDGGRAVGKFQLHTIYVDDVNRILGATNYQYADRWNPKRSEQMTRIYLAHWGAGDRLKPVDTIDWCIKLAQVHQGGPRGHLRSSDRSQEVKQKVLNWISENLSELP